MGQSDTNVCLQYPTVGPENAKHIVQCVLDLNGDFSCRATERVDIEGTNALKKYLTDHAWKAIPTMTERGHFIMKPAVPHGSLMQAEAVEALNNRVAGLQIARPLVRPSCI